MQPFNLGGEMIRSVALDHAGWNELPYKFEAGTPAIAEAVGFGAARRLRARMRDSAAIEAHEHELVAYTLERLGELPGAADLRPARDRRTGIVSFKRRRRPSSRCRSVLDSEGVAVGRGITARSRS